MALLVTVEQELQTQAVVELVLFPQTQQMLWVTVAMAVQVL
jgi:hypothetical protein